MTLFEDKTACCGCTACASVCGHGAISMRPDGMGFLYPVVDAAKCVECGLCLKVCAFNGRYDTRLNLPIPEAYAVRHRDIHEVETSRAGAAFVALSDWVLFSGGVVYGAGYSDHFRVVHKRADSFAGRNEFKGSKYVQSDLRGGIFRAVKDDLKNGKDVLFSGTPCYTSGLRSFIGNNLRGERLYLVDIICHGVPSPYVWRDYIAFVERQKEDVVCAVNFRDKGVFGWASHRETFRFEKEKDKAVCFSNSFYSPIIFRPSCSVCPFCNVKRPSDITLGDLWGWEKIDPNLNRDDKGISLLLINTAKGRRLFSGAKDYLDVKSVRIEDCIQPNLKRPTLEHPYRKKFARLYERHGFMCAAKKCGYAGMGVKHRVKMLGKKMVAAGRRILSRT